ncbi:TetR/AcrR family transcriptional regulator C-terminal domain-containing protein [Streptomyces sp. NPDC001966]
MRGRGSPTAGRSPRRFRPRPDRPPLRGVAHRPDAAELFRIVIAELPRFPELAESHSSP